MARDEGFHPLGSSLDVCDAFGPEGGAGVALLAGRERRVVAGGAFIAEDAGDADPADALAGFRVA